MTDEDIEAEIQAKGLTAPRVTQASIEGRIRAESYFTAADGAAATGGPVLPELGLLTLCVLVLDNGFTVLGKSACASPENFNAELGRKIARQDAIDRVWGFEGYLLKQRLYEDAVLVEASGMSMKGYEGMKVAVGMGVEYRALGERRPRIGKVTEIFPSGTLCLDGDVYVSPENFNCLFFLGDGQEGCQSLPQAA